MTMSVLPGIEAKTLTTARLTTRVLFSGPSDGVPVVFVHGNVSTASFWEETMLRLPQGFLGIAYDQRGYGGADPLKKIDATRGTGDLSDDLAALLDALHIEAAHVVGHSAGGSVLWRFLMDYPARCRTVTMVAPGSPFGFGGSKGAEGQTIWPDGAGSGGGTVNPTFPPRLAAKDASGDDPAAPRVIMNSFYWKPPFEPEHEEHYLASMFETHIGPEDYPGDMVPSANWPMVAPGKFGMNNALAPIYQPSIDKLYGIAPKPPVLWIHGVDDQIVGDMSFFEMGTLGKLGAVPGWPGEDVYPPQPMKAQTRAVLEKYQAAGGETREVAIAEAGHTPYVEKPAEFDTAFHAWIQR